MSRFVAGSVGPARGDNRTMGWIGVVATLAGSGGGAPDRAGLTRRLKRLDAVFDVPAVRSGSVDTGTVVEYYERCVEPYRKYHSTEGALHMALAEAGQPDDGYRGQLRRLLAQWDAPAAPRAIRDVLELACGQGFNLAWLAAQRPALRFEGVDLTPAHHALASARLRAAGLDNVGLRLADFHALPHADASFDALFAIEGFCHASDLPRALAEAARVLRPGGTFTLFDGYRVRPSSALDEEESLAVELVARGMALNHLQGLDELLDHARAAGFEPHRVEALDREVMPSLQRLERLTGAVVRVPWLGRRALARRHPARGRNVLAGYLLRTTVNLGLLGYRQVVLRRAS